MIQRNRGGISHPGASIVTDLRIEHGYLPSQDAAQLLARELNQFYFSVARGAHDRELKRRVEAGMLSEAWPLDYDKWLSSCNGYVPGTWFTVVEVAPHVPPSQSGRGKYVAGTWLEWSDASDPAPVQTTGAPR